MELEGKTVKEDGQEEMVSSAHFEPSTLQWPEDRDPERGKDGADDAGGPGTTGDAEGEVGDARAERLSPHGGESRTESERELRGGAAEEWPEGDMDDAGLRRRGQTDQAEIEVEEEEEEEEGVNSLPKKAAQVFNPAVTILRSSSAPATSKDTEEYWKEMETAQSPFLAPHGTPPDGYYQDWAMEGESPKWGSGCCRRDALKMAVSVCTAALFFPLLVWGGFVFLPFDAPVLNSAPLRLVYTLRCSVFAVVPIVLGWLVLGVSRLCLGAVKPMCDGEVEAREVGVHRRFVDDSISLFLVYFLQLAVMAPYLSQDLLKLVPLLTITFAFGRLVYWVAAALGSSIRGFGFGLSFLPTVAMLGANLYFIFAMDANGTIFADEARGHEEPPAAPRQRFWG